MAGFSVQVNIGKAGGVSMEREGDTRGFESVFVPDQSEDPQGFDAAIRRIWGLYSHERQATWIAQVEKATQEGPLGGINHLFEDLLGPKGPDQLREQAIVQLGRTLVQKYSRG